MAFPTPKLFLLKKKGEQNSEKNLDSHSQIRIPPKFLAPANSIPLITQ